MDAFYSSRFAEHGPTARGVDWPDEAAQEVRFEQLMRIAEHETAFSILDYGCGYGALVPFLVRRGVALDYVGFDLCEATLGYARTAFGHLGTRFVADDDELEPADFVVASGVFNMPFGTPAGEWTASIVDTLDRFDALACKGFAFNLLTSYSDRECMRADLYYGDAPFFFDLCKRRYSANVALLHDYGRWEWTMLVRKDV
jgi:SAM-dependent methyltransferase